MKEGTINVGLHEVKAAQLVFATAGKQDRPKLFPTAEVGLFKLYCHDRLLNLAEYDIVHHINGHLPDQDRVACWLINEDHTEHKIKCVCTTFKCKNGGHGGLPEYVRCGYLLLLEDVNENAAKLNAKCWENSIDGEMGIPAL